ncbi:MAG: hypothetical protein M1824_004318 [Vezdaea acicularis]|nr:MAG: hypothetical protein M1824_004318 [Vezdaea acicularis]
MEQLIEKHRKELRDLKSQIAQKKKEATKKTRKGVNSECERLEEELKERQTQETQALKGGTEAETINDALEELPDEPHNLGEDPKDRELAGNGISKSNNEAQELGSTYSSKKPNRQKARLARRAAEHKAQISQASEEAINMPNLREQERAKMVESCEKRGLKEEEIRPDGHCLYAAVADQLSEMHISLTRQGLSEEDLPPYKSVRYAAANYMADHPDDFEPFLEEPLPGYLKKIRDTGEWGGQLELLALARTYAISVNVLQADGRIETIGCGSTVEENQDKSIWLAYYRHYFGLGEHYNSLRRH